MVKGQTLVASDGYEVALYPFESIRITQSYKGNTSHAGKTIANTGLWDVTGVTGDNPLGAIYAPFSGVIVACKTGAYDGNQRILVSNAKVHLANGNLEIARFSWGHDNKLLVKLGSKVKQGDLIGYCGNKSATAIHSHLMLGVGKWTLGNYIPLTYNKNDVRIFYMPNAINIDDMFYINGIRTIGKYEIDGKVAVNWKEFNDMNLDILKVDRDTTRHQVEIKEVIINTRNKPSLEGEKLGKAPIGIFNVYETKEADNYHWVRIGNDVWLAETGNCFVDYPASSSTDYKEKYEEEVKKYNELNGHYVALNTKLEKVKEIVQ